MNLAGTFENLLDDSAESSRIRRRILTITLTRVLLTGLDF